MLHGIMSNGKVFYSESGKGLAGYLAKAGFDVYALDTAGRGKSIPKLSASHNLGQTEIIKEQIPMAHRFVFERHPHCKVHWCAHSWGGVLLLSSFIRYPELQQSVSSLLTFGTKRAIKTQSLKKWLMVDLVWNRVAPALARKEGFFAADKWRMGMDNESQSSLEQCIKWVKGDWLDDEDGFDYQQAGKALQWPPSWFIAAKRDTVLGNPIDVQRTMRESGLTDARYTLLSRQQGFKHDYDHASMLTHVDAEFDHFPLVLDWYLSQSIKGVA